MEQHAFCDKCLILLTVYSEYLSSARKNLQCYDGGNIGQTQNSCNSYGNADNNQQQQEIAIYRWKTLLVPSIINTNHQYLVSCNIMHLDIEIKEDDVTFDSSDIGVQSNATQNSYSLYRNGLSSFKI